jgi:DNA replication protein DnaC
MSADSLVVLLRALKLPSFVAHHRAVAERAEREGWSFLDFLRELAGLEVAERAARRIDRLRSGSGLPGEKTLATLNAKRLPAPIRRQLPTLCSE